MSTHPVPFVRGSSILAWEQREMIVIAPANGTILESPAGTYELYLPASRTVSVHAEPLDRNDASALVFHGEYSWVDRPNLVGLAPVRTLAVPASCATARSCSCGVESRPGSAGGSAALDPDCGTLRPPLPPSLGLHPIDRTQRHGS